MASFVVAAALFVIGTSYLVQFVVHPPSGATASLEQIDMRSRGQQALQVLLGTPGIPSSWGVNSGEIDGLDRLGLMDFGSSSRVNATKFDALARGSYATSSNQNGAVDYAEAKAALGLEGYDFHLRAYPVDSIVNDNIAYGVEDMADFRVAYVGKFSGAAYSTPAMFEADALDNLAITFLNATRSSNALGDVYQDDSDTLRQYLLPNLGTSLDQEVLGAGSGTNYDFARVAASTYSSFLTLNVTGDRTRAMALSSADANLGYAKSREIRSIAGTANLTGTTTGTLATVNWWEWVDTDKGNGTTDCQDYGYVEVSGDGGATWSTLTDTLTTRSQDCSPTVILPRLSARSVDITATNCASCVNAPSVLLGFHWLADNDNNRGYGWVVDDVQVINASDGKVLGRETFESPEYDLLVIGSDVSHNAFTPAEVKDAIRDYVSSYGGRIMVLGGQSNVQWLDRLFDAAIGGGTGGVATPDATHPLLTLPNTLSYSGYAVGTPWDFSTSGDSGLFTTVTGADESHPYLAVSRQGTWGDNDTAGSVVLTSYTPGSWGASGKDEARRFFANTLVYGRFHYLYLEVGPPIPTSESVASATRSATMNKMRSGDASYTEILFVIYIWPGSSTATTLQAATVNPLPVRSLTAEASDGRVWVNWTWPLANGSGYPQTYEIWRGSSPLSLTSYRSLNATQFSGTFLDATASDVTNTQSYWYNVSLVSTSGRGTSSSAVTGTPLARVDAPTGVAAASAVGGINVSWTPPGNAGIGPLYGYSIWMNDTSGGFTQVADVGNVAYHLQPINVNATYTFKVTAINGRGASELSAVSNGAYPLVTLAVAAPSLVVTHVGAGPNNLSLTWVSPLDYLGQTPAGFNLWRSADDTTYDLLASLSSAANTTFLDATLTANTTRYYKVQALTDVLSGLNSTAASGTTYAVPAPPGAFNVTNVTAHQLTLTWTAPDTGGLTLLGYRIERSVDGADFAPLVSLGGATGPLNLSFDDAAVSDNVTYAYKVQAFTSAGDGDLTSAQTMRTQGVPWQVTELAKVIRVNGVSVTMEWAVPSNGGSPILTYEIWRGATEGAETYLGLSPTSSYTDLTADYSWYKVRANNTLGSGPWSSSVHMVDTASKPTLTSSNATAHQIGLSWTPPTDLAGGTLSGYTLERSPDGSSWTSLSASTSLANRTWADLNVVDNTSYSYRVAAITEAGVGAWSTTATQATTHVPWPVSLTLTNTTAHALGISWSAANQGGGSYASFTVERSTDGASWATLVTSTNTNRSWSDATVSDNTTYWYRVFETNDVGTGSYSASATKASAGVAWPPSGLAKTSSIFGISITMSWNAPNDGGSSVTSYEIYRDGVSLGTSLTTSYIDVTAGASSHSYKVRAINGVGTGNFGASVTMSS